MTDIHDTGTVAAEIHAGHPRHIVGRITHWIPWFVYVLIVYIIIELSVGNVRETILPLGAHSLTWVEVIYCLATAVAMIELLRVSNPGVDNTKEALFMAFVWVLFAGLALMSATGHPTLRIFNTSEFLVITVISLVQVIMAFLLNARTLRRSVGFDNSVHGN